MTITKIIEGEFFNLTFDHKKIIKGWYLILTKEGDEYLVQRNYSFSSNWPRNIYQVEQSLKEKIISEEDYQKFLPNPRNKNLGVILGIALAPLGKFLPRHWFIGDAVDVHDMWRGLLNVLLLIMAYSVSMFFLFAYRKIVMEKKVGKLHYIGKVKAKTPLKILKKGKGFW
ncbi:hypothetical protein [Streptococcus sp. CSL10205-OR2]|uniref:hypothetical protein n=1 Tax=Streptococcus sp. CSL10205-OR2 TaxID=2980558 RepID=UPI0021DA2CB3|nr:hypothetical protein [Streptococcus sp. CSL10205-OR2]MCU9533525.1 hypothetical protein [Streptococcus sp. CSL10205-OR2]